MHADLLEAHRVLTIEIEALQKLQSSLDLAFIDAVEVLHRIKGRIIITGMGKSGHVARKIAATMASTGTPAYFVHPSEASHGDLGMITPEDGVVALSNSGETRELSDLVSFTRRYHIPLIAITQGESSALAKHADICLALPKVPEACPNQLAPTTSTTMMIALGDALALCLLKHKGFSREDYKNFHPGGSLGNMLRSVKDIMYTGEKIPLVSVNTLMPEVITMITSKSLGLTGVLNDKGKLVGIITDGDLRRHISNDLLSKQAGDIMTLNPRTIQADALVEEAVHLMNEGNARKITSLFVLDPQGRACGLIHMHQCLQWT